MFGKLFGRYLLDKKRITEEQFETISQQLDTVRVKLGTIAIAEGLLDVKTVEKINRLQGAYDKRFGDIAVEKGYLTNEQIEMLLSKQGNEYMQFLEIVVENHIMTIDEVEENLKKFAYETKITEEELERIMNGQVEDIVGAMLKLNQKKYIEHYILVAKNIVRFIGDDFLICDVKYVDRIECKHLACQIVNGDEDLFLGISGDAKALAEVAGIYAREKFDDMDEDAYDAICEFINCVNGLFVTNICNEDEDMELELMPPVFYDKCTLSGGKKFYVVTLRINGKVLDVISAIDVEMIME